MSTETINGTTHNVNQEEELQEVTIPSDAASQGIVDFSKFITNMKMLGSVSRMIAGSGMFGKVTPENVGTRILMGAGLGLNISESLQFLYVINGKPVVAAACYATKIKAHDSYDYRVNSLTDDACEIEFYSDGESLGTSSFTYAEAQKAGIAKGSNWQNYRTDMLFSRAMSRGGRRFCPDVLNGAYVEGELDDRQPMKNVTPEQKQVEPSWEELEEVEAEVTTMNRPDPITPEYVEHRLGILSEKGRVQPVLAWYEKAHGGDMPFFKNMSAEVLEGCLNVIESEITKIQNYSESESTE